MKFKTVTLAFGSSCLVLSVLYHIGSQHFEHRKPAVDFIIQHGYPGEVHQITTEDGYILSLHRIPNSPKTARKNANRPPILLVHGLMSGPMDFLNFGPEKDLGFILTDAGYDVWILGCRGTTGSKKHINMSSIETQYWNFSLHEIGVYDLTASIDYIINVTGSQQIAYLGQSQGTTVFSILLSEKPSYNAKIKTFIAMLPSIYICKGKESRIFYRLIKNLRVLTAIQTLFGHFNVGDNTLLRISLGLCNYFESPCLWLGYYIADLTDAHRSDYLDEIFFDNHPEGASSKQLLHFYQFVTSCEFRRFVEDDQPLPELYDLRNLNVSSFFLYATNDQLVLEENINFLRGSLFRKKDNIKYIQFGGFGHSDMVVGSRRQPIFKKILEILENVWK